MPEQAYLKIEDAIVVLTGDGIVMDGEFRDGSSFSRNYVIAPHGVGHRFLRRSRLKRFQQTAHRVRTCKRVWQALPAR